MKLPIHIAKQLLFMQQGNKVPAAQMKHPTVTKLLDDNILFKRRTGTNRGEYSINDSTIFQQYLSNHFGIANLEEYINGYEQESLTRSEAIHISSDSKLKTIRTFRGFLVNSFQPIEAELNNQSITIHPATGSFAFIYDFEQFSIPPPITIVGVENPENFRFIQQQQYLFKDIQPLFISRYPQTQYKDVMKWLLRIPNQYLHFGDFDLEGINLYLREFKNNLGERASFFVPENVEGLIQQKGNRKLYDQQLGRMPDAASFQEESLRRLLNLIHQYKKGLEQEVLIHTDNKYGE